MIIGNEAGVSVGATTTVYTGYVTGTESVVTSGCVTIDGSVAITSPVETGEIVVAATGTTASVVTGTVAVAIC